mmetsp:Transcript_13040/g.19001  ORF Transcript_13040/g.19001 Transcript_13040/m.19001 type:complete len:101 (-) Transcript_13040:157-459(-)|eukprot:CAMPEP_0197235624 /NCGR_PEP_ID=MMETSP1429-20130617/3002_1 /TAXON_ID=49237 /ORGANISM="Chaetoceros  sp., Strain UNC1202" /LENGTH=100 /DNA_ID=CAMNT_0042694253 /DNA_START=106 /DNA_END=408 /DNA_ORIENTATION=+
MENFQNLPQYQKKELEQNLANMQVKDSLTMYLNLVERCFEPCVNNFRSKQLDKWETKCLDNCADRYIKAANRSGIRFQEHQAMEMKRAQDMAKMGGAPGV